MRTATRALLGPPSLGIHFACPLYTTASIILGINDSLEKAIAAFEAAISDEERKSA